MNQADTRRPGLEGMMEDLRQQYPNMPEWKVRLHAKTEWEKRLQNATTPPKHD